MDQAAAHWSFLPWASTKLFFSVQCKAENLRVLRKLIIGERSEKSRKIRFLQLQIFTSVTFVLFLDSLRSNLQTAEHIREVITDTGPGDSSGVAVLDKSDVELHTFCVILAEDLLTVNLANVVLHLVTKRIGV